MLIESIYVIVGILLFFFSFLKSRNVLDPHGLFALVWFGSVAISSLSYFRIGIRSTGWEAESHAAIFLSGISFCLPNFFAKFPQSWNTQLRSNCLFRQLLTFFILLNFCALCFRFVYFEYNFFDLIGRFYLSGDKKEAFSQAIPYVHYFEILTPVLAIAAYFELRSYSGRSIVWRFFLVIYFLNALLVHCFLISFSRGDILAILLGVLYVENCRRRISLKLLLYFGLVGLLSFAAMSFLRLGTGSLVNSFFGPSGWIRFFSPIYTYISFGFDNFDSLVKHASEPSYFLYSLKFLLWPVFKDEYLSGDVQLFEHATLFFNNRPLIYGFYHDLGLLGCFIYPFTLGLILCCMRFLEIKYRSFTLLIACVQKAIVFSFFGNYFFGETVVVFPLLVAFILVVSAHLNLKNSL